MWLDVVRSYRSDKQRCTAEILEWDELQFANANDVTFAGLSTHD